VQGPELKTPVLSKGKCVQEMSEIENRGGLGKENTEERHKLIPHMSYLEGI
jgi:hypothetical protein